MTGRGLMCTALLVPAGLARPAGMEDTIRKAEKDWAAAVVANDFAEVDQFLSPDLIYGHSSGAIETKDEYMKRLRGGAQRYEAIEHHKMTVKVNSDTAVVHSLVRMAGKSNDRLFNNELMMLHVWISRDGRWQLAGHQTAEMP